MLHVVATNLVAVRQKTVRDTYPGSDRRITAIGGAVGTAGTVDTLRVARQSNVVLYQVLIEIPENFCVSS